MAEQGSDLSPGVFDGPLGGFAEQGLELGEDLLDGIEVWTVLRQEEELGAGGANGVTDCLALMAAEIVNDDDVAGLEGRDKQLFDVGAEAVAIDRPVDDAGSIDAIMS